MSDTASVTSECAKGIVNGVDFLARHFDLRTNPVPLSTKIGDLGLGDNDCAIVERNIQAHRNAAGKPPIKAGSIKSSTTIQELITHAC